MLQVQTFVSTEALSVSALTASPCRAKLAATAIVESQRVHTVFSGFVLPLFSATENGFKKLTFILRDFYIFLMS